METLKVKLALLDLTNYCTFLMKESTAHEEKKEKKLLMKKSNDNERKA